MRFSGSKAISDGFAILSARFAPMTGIVAAFYILPALALLGFFLTQIMTVLVPLMAPDQPSGDIGAFFAMFNRVILPLIGFGIVYGLIRLLGTCALTAAAAGREDEGTGDAIRGGARALLPMLGFYLLIWLAWILVFGALFGSTFYSLYTSARNGTPPELGSIGMLLLVMPVLLVAVVYLFAKLSLVMPVIVIERVGNPISAMARSWQLTKGASLKIILIYILVGIVQLVLQGVISGLTGNSLMPDPSDPATMFGGTGFWLSTGLSMVVGAVAGMYVIALLVGIHRQVSGPQTEDVSDTFS